MLLTYNKHLLNGSKNRNTPNAPLSQGKRGLKLSEGQHNGVDVQRVEYPTSKIQHRWMSLLSQGERGLK